MAAGTSNEDEDSEPYDPIADMDFGYMEQPEDLERLTKTVEDLENKLAQCDALQDDVVEIFKFFKKLLQIKCY